MYCRVGSNFVKSIIGLCPFVDESVAMIIFRRSETIISLRFIYRESD